MTAAAATLAGRAAAEALMVDTCTITRAAGRTFDDATGTYTTDAATSVYSGPCRVRPRDNQDHVVQAGDRPVSLWPFVVSLPAASTGVDVDDLVTITASDLDPDLVGTVLRVRHVARGTHITARRLGCEVNAG